MRGIVHRPASRYKAHIDYSDRCRIADWSLLAAFRTCLPLARVVSPLPPESIPLHLGSGKRNRFGGGILGRTPAQRIDELNPDNVLCSHRSAVPHLAVPNQLAPAGL